MRAVPFIVATAAVLGALGCKDATAPAQTTLRELSQFRVPDSAAATDSIHISFAENTQPCDNNVTVSSTMNDTGMTFSASVETHGACKTGYPPGIYLPPVYSYVVVPPHPVPFTVEFAQPGGTDSVRVVRAP